MFQNFLKKLILTAISHMGGVTYVTKEKRRFLRSCEGANLVEKDNCFYLYDGNDLVLKEDMWLLKFLSFQTLIELCEFTEQENKIFTFFFMLLRNRYEDRYHNNKILYEDNPELDAVFMVYSSLSNNDLVHLDFYFKYAEKGISKVKDKEKYLPEIYIFEMVKQRLRDRFEGKEPINKTEKSLIEKLK